MPSQSLVEKLGWCSKRRRRRKEKERRSGEGGGGAEEEGGGGGETKQKICLYIPVFFSFKAPSFSL